MATIATAKKPLPPPPGKTGTARPLAGTAVAPVASPAATAATAAKSTAAPTPTPPPPGATYSRQPEPGYVAPLINAATEATNAQGDKGIGSGGFRADVSIGNDMDKLIQKNLTDRLEGRNPSFSDEIMAHNKEKLFKETTGATRRGRMSLMADAARRGVFRSEATGTLIRDVEIAGMQQYSSGVKDLMIEKAKSDHKDMTEAITAAQQWMQGLRQYSLGLEQNAIAREQIKATLAAAAMQASASMYAADQGLKGARANAGAIRAGQQQQYNDSRAITFQSGGLPPIVHDYSIGQRADAIGGGFSR
jgi:hypothetical protein